MTVALWWEATSTVIDTGLALLTLAMAIPLTGLSVNPARNGKIAPAAAIAVALAAMLQLSPHTAAASELQDAITRQMTVDGPYATQMWATVWSNIHTMTVCTVMLHYIATALAILMFAAVLLTVFGALRRYANHPAAQTATGGSVVEGIRRTWLDRRELQTPPNLWSRITTPRPGLLAAAVAVVAALSLIGAPSRAPESPAAQQRSVSPPTSVYTIGNMNTQSTMMCDPNPAADTGRRGTAQPCTSAQAPR